MALGAQRSYVSPRDLAAAIEVSESSLKRWADGGLLRVTRTAGGHRRIPIGEAIRFVREAKLRVADPSKLGFRSLGPTMPHAGGPAVEEVEALFLAHRGPEAAGLLLRCFLGGVAVAELCDGPLRGALSRVGHLHEKSPEGIAIEHGAVEACTQALHSMLRCLPTPEPGAPVAIGGAAVGDPYVLPSLSVAAVLAEAGCRILNVGPNAPVEAIEAVAVGQRARLAWRSFSIDLSDRELERETAGIERLSTLPDCDVVLGGRGRRIPLRTARVHHFTCLDELSGFARGLVAARAERNAV